MFGIILKTNDTQTLAILRRSTLFWKKFVNLALFHKKAIEYSNNELDNQRYRTQRAWLHYKNFDFLSHLSWSGSFPQSKHNIMKVVQTIYLQKYNKRVCPKKSGPFHWLGVDLNLYKVLGHTWDPLGSPPGL